MRNRLIVAVLLTLVVVQSCIVVVSRAQAPSPTSAVPPGTATGQRIGNAISAAVSTAFPEVQKILDVIWPNRSAKPNETKKAADAAAPLQQAKAQADQKQTPNVKDINKAAHNLVVLRSFVTICSDASVSISAMQAFLSDKTAEAKLSEQEKARLHDLWDPTSKELDKLTTDATSTAINSMDDDYLKTTITLVQGAISRNAVNVARQIDQGRVVDLRSSLDRVQPQLTGVGPLAGVLIGDLGSSLSQAASNIAGAAGSEDASSVRSAAQDRQANLAILKKIYADKKLDQ